jgi:hypothetical protein
MAAAGVAVVVLLVGRFAQAAPPREGDVRAAVKAVLAKPEYNPPKPGLAEQIRQRIYWVIGKVIEAILKPVRWLADKLGQLGVSGSPVARWLVVGLLTAVLILIVLHIYYTAAGAFISGRRRGGAGLSLDLAADVGDLMTRAKLAAEKGDFRAAVSLLYQATLLRLDRAGLIRFYPSRTNWQYVEVIEGRADLAGPFRRMTLIADRAMYSTAPVEPRHYADAGDALGEMEGALT